MSAGWKLGISSALLALLVAAIVVFAAIETGFAERWIRDALISQLEQRTGTRVEIINFRLQPWALRAEIDGLTLHGLEPAVGLPLFHADRIELTLRVLSLLGRRFVIDQLFVGRPRVVLTIDRDGRSNVPPPPAPAGNRPWRETLFRLRIVHLRLAEGSVNLADRTVPLDVQGGNLNFDLSYAAAPGGADSYVGTLTWQQVEMAEQRSLPFRFDLSTKFTLYRDAFEVDELICKLPHSELNLRAELPSFERSDWNLHYRGRISLADVKKIFRAPTIPDAVTDFSGEARYTAGQGTAGEWQASGYYRGHDVRMPYQYFHARGLETWGDYEIVRGLLVVPNLKIRALGGAVDGRLEMDVANLKFRTTTRSRGFSLAAALAAVNNPSLPVNPLHWDGSMDVDSVNTWDKDFQHFRSTGQSRWSPPQTLAAGMISTSARIDYDYSLDRSSIAINKSEISTPKMQLHIDGFLGASDSALEVQFRTGDLLDWDDFINIIRGADAVPRRIAGAVAWDGRILGPLAGPTFIGHMLLTDAHYDTLYWDGLEGDMEYSPDVFRLTKTVVRRGKTSANLDLALAFDGDWNFLPSSNWSLNTHLERAPSEDLQAMFGTRYPATGLLSGDVRGGGTRDAPVFDSNFAVEPIEIAGSRFDRLAGQLHLQHDEIRLSGAELRRDHELVAGDVTYRPQEQEANFDITGTGILLDKIRTLQNISMPLGGAVSFQLKGSGPLRAPVAQGDWRVSNLKLGTEMEGNFVGQLGSDGRNARFSLASDLTQGKVQATVTVGLTGEEPISGRLSVEQFDLDPLIVAGLHLKQLTGHSTADGIFTISGALRQPDSIEVDADITRIALGYELVQLTNDQNIKVTYHRNEVRIEQAHLHGADTDLQVSGAARFDRDRPLHLALSGGVNLRLLSGVLPDLHALGRADANVSVEGTITRPRVTGRATVRGVSATYADFPIGLSKVTGDFVFDKSRLVFDRLSAESGGGQMALSGSVSYGDEGPVRYGVSATTSQVRIRYPAGMSWLVGGTLQLSGTSSAAVVSGRVQVQRLLFAQGVDLTSFFAASSEPAAESVSSSPFLQNLTFDVEGQTNPGARIEWTGAQVEMDGDVRLRGTWDRPVLLGHIHLLGGQMPFRGNTFQLTRGDINFANPFRLDPVLNVEATSTISQYQVTVDFSGSASHLLLNYRSDPPLPDSDVIALLALGSTGEEGGLRSQSASSQNYGATALLSEAISSGLGGRIEHLFGISQFRVDPFVAGAATESNAAARVTIEQHVRNDLTITYSTNAATSNQYQMIQVEYAVKRDLSVVFLRDINGTNGLDIKWVKHFK